MNPTSEENVPQIEWQTPVLTEASVAESTQQFFSAGIDNYEATNPVSYGS
jgi:hypothetical protein